MPWTDLIKIKNTDFTPGPPWNSLDRYFFIPWEIEETRTIDELLTLMLRESDNTATDKLLGLIGGVNAVNDFMCSLHLKGYWLGASAKILFDKMQQCVTGLEMIRKSANHYCSHIKRIGYKTGSIGGIFNDAAFIQFDNDQWMVLSIHTCFSPLEKSARTAVIADLAADILDKNSSYQKDLLSIGYHP